MDAGLERSSIRIPDSTYHLETLATRFDRSDTGDSDAGDVVPPIHLSTTHEMHSPGESDHGYKYTRFGNPTRDGLTE